MKPPHATAQQSITTKTQTVAMMQLMQMRGVPYPTPALANAVIRLLESIYKEDNNG